jgi:hypothetical protein
MLPPLEEEGVADQLEPWGKFQTVVTKHGLQLFRADIARVADLVGVGDQVNVGLDEKDIINYDS